MSFFAAIPFSRTLVVFIPGIITGIYCQFNFWQSVLAFLFFLLVYLLENYCFKIASIYRYRFFNGIIFSLTMFFFGTALVHLTHETNYSLHFSKFTEKNNFLKTEIIAAPIEKDKTYKCIGRVKQIKTAAGKWKPVNGKLLFYLTKETDFIPKLGDELVLKSSIKPIPERKNPSQFDYRQYLYYHNIFHQTYIGKTNFIVLGRQGNALYNYAYDLREKLIASFQKNGLQGNELAVAGALLFGVTDQLEPSLIRAYAATGALHVLSVSGLHVGIIYGFLQLVFSFFPASRKSQLIKGTLILCCIWFYALLTGLTPSVLRSATMFTFVVLGQLLTRKSSPLNSIAASAFVLLAYDPFLIMEVGFQLSYLAVAGILFIHPLIESTITVRNKFVRPIWAITSVSIAAQIATFPLGLMYFHQFPNYFLFSNLIVIPLSGIILYIGILASVIGIFPVVQHYLIELLSYTIYALNSIVSYIEELPYALLEGISIGIKESLLCYCIIALVLVWINTGRTYLFKFILGCLLALSLIQMAENISIQHQQQFVVYHIKGHTGIDFINGKNHHFISDSAFYANKDLRLFNVQHHWDDKNLVERKTHLLESFNDINQNSFHFAQLNLKILNEKYDYKKHSFKNCSIVLLTNDCKFSFRYLKEDQKKILFIADASNSTKKLNLWEHQAQKYQVKFYNIEKKGAFIKSDLSSF